jgi:hypothetical protein
MADADEARPIPHRLHDSFHDAQKHRAGEHGYDGFAPLLLRYPP